MPFNKKEVKEAVTNALTPTIGVIGVQMTAGAAKGVTGLPGQVIGHAPTFQGLGVLSNTAKKIRL